jgi:hypothetical protein
MNENYNVKKLGRLELEDSIFVSDPFSRQERNYIPECCPIVPGWYDAIIETDPASAKRVTKLALIHERFNEELAKHPNRFSPWIRVSRDIVVNCGQCGFFENAFFLELKDHANDELLYNEARAITQAKILDNGKGVISPVISSQGNVYGKYELWGIKYDDEYAALVLNFDNETEFCIEEYTAVQQLLEGIK